MKPLLSVIVANHNHEEYLGECLESILGQTFSELEVLVVDDASTDGSVTLIREFQRREPERIRLLPLRRRRGPAYARNQGALQAMGKYLTTLDADDVYADKDKLKREVELLARIADREGIDAAAFSDVLEVAPDGSSCRWSDRMRVNQGWILESLLKRDGFIPRDFVFPRRSFNTIGGYDPRLRTHEDWDLKIRLAGILPFYYTKAPGVVYRRHESGLSRSRHHVRMCNLWRVFRRNLHKLPRNKQDTVRRFFGELMARQETQSHQYPLGEGRSGRGWVAPAGWAVCWRRFFCGRIDALGHFRKCRNRREGE